MRWYLDSSIALHAVLPWGDVRALAWAQKIDASEDLLVSSTLAHLEVVRALRREQLDVQMASPVIDRLHLISIDDGVLRVAAAIEPHVKSLDAIHLATCAMLGSGITLVTHDASMAAVARTLGLDTFDPLASGDVR